VNLGRALTQELAPFPHALFSFPTSLLKADKPPIAEALLEHTNGAYIEGDIPITDRYIIDGGSLLYRLGWNRHSTYGEIATASYADLACKGRLRPTVIFDGYSNGPSTKDALTGEEILTLDHPSPSMRTLFS
jgi:hypothetical protein